MARKAKKKADTAEPMEEWSPPEPPEPRPLPGALVLYEGYEPVKITDAKRSNLKKSDRRYEIILRVLSQGYSVQTAANQAGVSRFSVFEWRRQDKAFDRACKEAMQSGIDLMEDEALRRAVQGVDEPVFQGGMLVGHVTKYSDRLLEMNLKARRPERWKEGHDDGKKGEIHIHYDDVDKDA